MLCITSTQILARVFVYLPPFISQILDFICRMDLIFILIYFEWRETENQQLWVIWTALRLEELGIWTVIFKNNSLKYPRVKRGMLKLQLYFKAYSTSGTTQNFLASKSLAF